MALKTLPITEARANLPQVVRAAHERFDRTIITTNGKPSAVIMSYDEYESWEETLEILSDPQAMADLREAAESVSKGKTFSFEEVFGGKQPGVRR